MLKSPLFFALSLMLIIANNLLFGMHGQSIVHALQIVLAIALCFHITWSMLNITAVYFPKQFEIPLFIAFIVSARSTESVIRKYLIKYYPDFYQEYKLYIFGFAVIVFLILVYFLQHKTIQNRIKAD